MRSLVWPSLARRTTSTSLRSPGMNRSSPMRSNGPLRMSRMPVASTTIAAAVPGQALVPGEHVLRDVPSSSARHGTMAGTQVSISMSDPT